MQRPLTFYVRPTVLLLVYRQDILHHPQDNEKFTAANHPPPFFTPYYLSAASLPAACCLMPPVPNVKVFGLPLIEPAMNLFFCSRELARRLRERNIPTTLLEVTSDHWSVLASAALSAALKAALCGDGKWLERQAS